jgi:hypothetical protein
MINKDEEREGVKSPVLPAMALGGGLLGLGAAQGLASDDQINRFRTAYNEYNPAAFGDPSQLPPNNTDLTYYERTMSPGAQFKPFGKPIGDLLVKVRSSEKLMGKEPIVDIDKLREGKYTKYLAQLLDRLGLTEPLTSGLNTASYHLATPDQQHGVSGGAHYRMFGNGPIPAYVHQMKAKYPSTKVPEELGVPEGTSYTDWMGRKLEDFLTDATGQRTNPYEFTTDLRSHEDQLKLMEDFHASLSPEEQTFRTQVEDLDAAKYQSQTGNYLPKAKAFADFRDTLKDVGITAGGAGLGGLLGHYLHRLAGGENEGRDLSHMAATGAGMGLGGLAGYFGGTQAGRQKVLDLLAKFKKESGDHMTLGLFFDDPKLAALTRSAVGESGLSVNMAPWSLQGEDAWPSAESYHTGRRRQDSLLPPGMKGTPIKPIENTHKAANVGGVIGGGLALPLALAAGATGHGGAAGKVFGLGRRAGHLTQNALLGRGFTYDGQQPPEPQGRKYTDEEISQMPEFAEYAERMVDPEDLMLDMPDELAQRYQDLTEGKEPETQETDRVFYGEDPQALAAYDEQMAKEQPDWYKYRQWRANNDEEADYYDKLIRQREQKAAAVKVAPSFSRQAKGKPDGPYKPGHTYQGSKTKAAVDWKTILPLLTAAAGGGVGLYMANRGMTGGDYSPELTSEFFSGPSEYSTGYVGRQLRKGTGMGAAIGGAAGAIPLVGSWLGGDDDEDTHKAAEELVDATEMAANAQEAEMSADELADQTEEILEEATKCGGLIVPFALMDDPFEKESGAAGAMGRLGQYADDAARGAKAVSQYGDDAARLAARAGGKIPAPGTMGNYARSAASAAGTTAVPTATGAFMGTGARTAGTAGQSVGRAATSTGRIGRAARRIRDSRVGDAARWVRDSRAGDAARWARKSPMVAQPLLQGGIGTGIGMGMDYARESDIEGETRAQWWARPFRHRLDKTDPNFSHYSNTAILGASGLASGLASGAMMKGLGPSNWAAKAVPVTAAGTAAYRGTGAAMAAGERAAYNMASATNAAKMVEEFGNDPSSQPFIPFLFDENGNQDLEGMGARFTRAMYDREYFQRIAPEALALMDQGIAQGSFAALSPLIAEAGPTLAKMFPDIFFDENGQPIQPENMEDLIGMVSQIGERFEGQDKGQIMMSMLSGMEPEQMATAFAEMQSTPEGQAFLQELAKQPKMKETIQSLMGGDGGGAMMMLDGIMGNFMGDFWKNMTGSQKMFFGLAIGSGILGILGTMSGSGLMGGGGLLAGLLFGGLSLFGNQIGDAIGGPVGEFIGGGQQTPPGTAAAEGGETAAPGFNEGKVTSQDVIEKMRRKNKPTEKMRRKNKAPAAEPFLPGAGIAAG